MKDVPFIVHESEMARMERIIKRLYILAIVLIVLLFCSNGAWIYYESQFEDVVTTTSQDIQQDVKSDSGDVVINDGVHINGESTAESSDNEND